MQYPLHHSNSFRVKRPQPNGYSILELVAVVGVLAILAGISVPAFLNFLKSSRIDGAKSILNSAAAACLQDYRVSPDTFSGLKVPDERIAGIEQLGYKKAVGKDKCVDFMITPSDPGEDFLFPMGFMISEGKLSKIAIPASDRGSENACKSWGTCGIPPELQAEWDRRAKIEADKKACNDAFYTFLNSGSKGQKNVWDDASQSCSRAQWVLDGTRYTSKEAYDAAFTAKVGKECAAKLLNYSNNNPPNGKYIDESCGIETYFLNGVNLETSDPIIYQSKQKEYNDNRCDAAENSWMSDGRPGAFTWPNGLSCTAKWKCPTENNKIYLSLDGYSKSPCGAPPPQPIICPPAWQAMGIC